MEQVQISSGREILTSLLFLDTVILDILGTLGTYHPEEVDDFGHELHLRTTNDLRRRTRAGGTSCQP